ncbi:hypothetical protein [Vibrio hepatarius]|uniref:hypothetical protein n=1 Tax=Vibrio hepatarius TaxID=171383 RepID=UPI000A46B121|nr:hypothetical protein [Vibrio hepatarius]NIY83800.1 hypothetical protein [Vibrio hepatarius]NVJ55283.1 hypothetical protein [Vibrionaceae bacterium]
MVETSNYQMAIDLLCCHLGLSEEEAMKQLGISCDESVQKHIVETQQAFVGLASEM